MITSDDLLGEKAPPQYRLVIDAAVCDAHGICALLCPDLISLDEWGYAAVEAQSFSAGATLRHARSAAAACPEGALRLVAKRG